MTADQIIAVCGLMLGCVGACLGGYIAIRGDLAKLHERATTALNRADTAHARIDRLMGQGS